MQILPPLYKKGKKDVNRNFVQKRQKRCQRKIYRKCIKNISKIFEKCMFEQMTQSFENVFSKYQQCPLAVLEKWKMSVNNSKAFGILLTDLSKAFDYLDHELLMAKLNAYGFSLTALKLVDNHLSNRKQRTKIDSSYSSLLEIIFEVSQESILGHLLLNIF